MLSQIGTKNSVELVEFPSDAVNEVAGQLGLRPVGWIFTDLIPLDTLTGTVKHFRGNVNSHFLSAEECIMAADLQTRHPNACHLSPDGHFGSKFVTVVVTGRPHRLSFKRKGNVRQLAQLSLPSLQGRHVFTWITGW